MPKGTDAAKKASTAVKKGAHQATKAKLWKKVTFRRPKTLLQKRAPKKSLKAVRPVSSFTGFDVIKHPKSSEAAIKTIEDNNTLVFIVHKRSNKLSIKQAVEQLYRIKIKKVNTLITPKGEKKAYCKLTSDLDALDIANKIGIM
jgi:large subunit ribosomal protein L23Ae